MPVAWTSPLYIITAKLNDSLTVDVDQETPFEPKLSIYDLDDSLLYGPAAADEEREGRHYWYVDVTSGFGFTASKQYRKLEIDDTEMTGYDTTTYMVYANDNKEFEDILTRALGLSGHNIRILAHVWTRGLLTQFDVKIYASKALLEAAEAGTSDTFIAHYRVVRTYNSVYNNYQTTSVRIS